MHFWKLGLNSVNASKRKSESPVSRTVLCWNKLGWLVSIKSMSVGFSECLQHVRKLQNFLIEVSDVFTLTSPTKTKFSYFLLYSSKREFKHLTLRARTVLNFWKNAGNLLYWLVAMSKVIHLDDKNLTGFTWNLVQNLMNLVFFLKAIGSRQQMVKTKVVRKNAKRCHSEAKG